MLECPSFWSDDSQQDKAHPNLLLSYALQRAVIVEAKVTSVQDMGGVGCLGQIVQRTKVAYKMPC